MSTIIVRGGLPGKVRIELEGTDVGIDLDVGLTGLDMIHGLKPLMEQLADYVAPPPEVTAVPDGPMASIPADHPDVAPPPPAEESLPVAPRRNSKAPKADT